MRPSGTRENKQTNKHICFRSSSFSGVYSALPNGILIDPASLQTLNLTQD
jgi:hypothetical protein